MTERQDDYSRYYYLWHLIAIGVLKLAPPPAPPPAVTNDNPHCPEIGDVIWEHESLDTDRDVKVALIDMGIAKFHPNLEPKDGGSDPQTSRVVWDEALDLASHQYGVKYKQTIAQRHREERLSHLGNCLDSIELSDRIAATPPEIEILESLIGGYGVEREVDVYKQSYATHGTACAGLVCGTSFSDDQFGLAGNPLIYYGVDPYSRIVPITTSISPDPRQLIAAFLYAHSLNVDAILFPRDAADPLKMPHYDKLDKNEKTRLDHPGPLDTAWALFEKVIKAVSVDIPIICAAGNDGRSELIYPASLANDDAGDRNGIIAVGSVSYKGYRSGYSNYGPGLTVVAPSDDGEVYNRHQIRLDRQAADASDFWVDDVHQHPDIPEIQYSAERLVTLDVPGAHGYATGSRNSPPRDRAEAMDDSGGLYTDIGGTSGASAIVAGIVALMQRQNAASLNGLEVKQALLGMGSAVTPNTDLSRWYWLDDPGAVLQPDAVNGLPNPEMEDLFGSGGLVDVRALLDIA